MSFLEHALDYAKRGWSIIPVRNDPKTGKKPPATPGRRWKTYQTKAADEDELRRLFKPSDITGLAVALGSASGGLCCRDFDMEGSYERWAGEYPELANCLPTVITRRGFHVYFLWDGPYPKVKLGDGEFLRQGHYSVLPPSIHPSGHEYRWHIKPEEDKA